MEQYCGVRPQRGLRSFARPLVAFVRLAELPPFLGRAGGEAGERTEGTSAASTPG